LVEEKQTQKKRMNAEHGEENVQVKPHAYVHSHNLDIWFLVILLQLLCNTLIQLIETTQLIRLVFYV